MTPERFEACLEAYGADLRRWPKDDYVAACRLMAHASPELLDKIAQAEALDALLQADPIAAPDEDLVRRIAAGAPAPRHAAAAPGPAWWRPRWVWPAGVAGVGLAGSLAGAFFVSAVLRQMPPPADGMERGTVFSAATADWSEE
ncbi:MAG TPA: hypothetical protein VIT92_08545 [Burkholderiaceae bacterium]